MPSVGTMTSTISAPSFTDTPTSTAAFSTPTPTITIACTHFPATPAPTGEVWNVSGTDDSFATARNLGVLQPYDNRAASGAIANWGGTPYSGDNDYYQFVIAQSGSWKVNVGCYYSSMNLDLFVYDASYNLIGSSTNPGYQADLVTLAASAGQTYYARVAAYDGFDWTPTAYGYHSYGLTISDAACSTAFMMGDEDWSGIRAVTVATGTVFQQYTVPQNVRLDRLSTFLGPSANSSLSMGIYSDNGGSPDQLLAATAPQAAAAWALVTAVITPIQLVPGNYWLAVSTSDPTLVLHGPSSSTALRTTLPGQVMPSAFSSAGSTPLAATNQAILYAAGCY